MAPSFMPCNHLPCAKSPSRLRGRQNGDTSWRCDVVMFPKFWLVFAASAQHFVADAHFVLDTKNVSENLQKQFLLPRFAMDGQNCRTQCWRHNVSSFCRGLIILYTKSFLLLYFVDRAGCVALTRTAHCAARWSWERRAAHQTTAGQRVPSASRTSSADTGRPSTWPAAPGTGNRPTRG